MSLAESLAKSLPPSLRQRVKPIAGAFYRNNLNMLARIFGTDKWGDHWYTQHYQRWFQSKKNSRLNMLEIGVGGYEDSQTGGESLRMWKAFFPKARIVGIDINDKTRFSERRIDIRICDQTDSASLQKLSEEYGGFDIIIDDGSHVNEHVIKTFHVLFPLLRADGIYAIEDTQTSYWPSFGGGMKKPDTMMAFFQSLTDGINHVEYPIADYEPTYFDKNIVEMAFFHNLILIRKGNNDEKTNSPTLLARSIAASE